MRHAEVSKAGYVMRELMGRQAITLQIEVSFVNTVLLSVAVEVVFVVVVLSEVCGGALR